MKELCSCRSKSFGHEGVPLMAMTCMVPGKSCCQGCLCLQAVVSEGGLLERYVRKSS